MITVKNILLYFIFTIALSGYLSYEFSGSFLWTITKLEAFDAQPDPESRECVEKKHNEGYPNFSSLELNNFSAPKQKQHYFLSHFKSNYHGILVWNPPKLS